AKRVESAGTFRGGLLTAFVYEKTGEPGGVYLSTDGELPGQVAHNTSVVYDSEVAHLEALVEIPAGVLSAFYASQGGWGIYLSPSDARRLVGEDGQRAYVGRGRVDAMLPYREGVITALYEPWTGRAMGVYFSPDGLDL